MLARCSLSCVVVHHNTVQNWFQIDGAVVVGPGPFVTESHFKHLSKFSSFSRRLVFWCWYSFGFILVDVMSDPKDLHRLSLVDIQTAFSAWHTLCLMHEICMWLKCVMECFGQIIVPGLYCLERIWASRGRVSQNSQKGQNALVPVRLFNNIMVFMICTMGMWISQWAQWVDPRKKPVHCTLVRGLTEGSISMGESLCSMK
jgi:hypothetical protein